MGTCCSTPKHAVGEGATSHEDDDTVANPPSEENLSSLYRSICYGLVARTLTAISAASRAGRGGGAKMALASQNERLIGAAT